MAKKPAPSGDPSGQWRTLAPGARPQVDEPTPGTRPDGEGEPAIVEQRKEPAAPSSDPYNRTGETGRRRLLDDMRRLSETIKNAPKRVRAADELSTAKSTLLKRLAMIRTDLECALVEIEALRSGWGVVPPSDATMADLIEQMRQAAHHLEESIDYLMPIDD